MDRNIGVQTKSVHNCATRTRKSVYAFRIDLISCVRDMLPGAGVTGHSATHRGGIDSGQPGLIARKGIRLFRIAIGAEATLAEKLSDPHRQCFCQSRDFSIIRSRKNLKLRLIVVIRGIDAIYHERVNMEIEQQHSKIPIVPLLGFTTVFIPTPGKNWKSSIILFVGVSGSLFELLKDRR